MEARDLQWPGLPFCTNSSNARPGARMLPFVMQVHIRRFHVMPAPRTARYPPRTIIPEGIRPTRRHIDEKTTGIADERGVRDELWPPVAEGKRPQGACLTKRVRAKEVAPTCEPNAVAGKPVSKQAIHGTGTQIRHANNRTLSPRTAPQAFTGRFHSAVTLSLYFAGNGSFFNYFFIYLQVKKNKPV